MASNQDKDSEQRIGDEPKSFQRRQRRRVNRNGQQGRIGAASVRQRICNVRYLKHLLVWQVIFFVGFGVGTWNSRTTSDGTTYIGLADLAAWASGVLIVAPIIALISWGGSGLFSSKPLDLDE